MQTKKSKGGKHRIVQDVMAAVEGTTFRRASKVVDAVFDRIRFALWCGDPVELPIGTLEVKSQKGKPRRKIQRFRNIQTGEIDARKVELPGRHRVIKFKPDPKLELPLDPPPPPPPPPPESPEWAHARQLVSELLGRPADQAMLDKLQFAVEFHPQRPWERIGPSTPERLIKRLEFAKSKSLKFSPAESGGVDQLAYELAMMHYIR